MSISDSTLNDQYTYTITTSSQSASIMNSSQPQKRRFKVLVDNIDKALSVGSKSFNAKAAVYQCYGNDANMFVEKGDHGTTSNDNDEAPAMNMLAELLSGAIERMNEEIQGHYPKILKEEQLETRLHLLDTVISDLREEEQTDYATEKHDQQSAQDALYDSKMPEGVSVDDVFHFKAHRMRMDTRERLVNEINAVTEENAKVEERIMSMKSRVQEFIQNMESRVKELEKTEASPSSQSA